MNIYCSEFGGNNASNSKNLLEWKESGRAVIVKYNITFQSSNLPLSSAYKGNLASAEMSKASKLMAVAIMSLSCGSL
ncbi:MAG: hypothetical protein NTX45_07185 [Proteobacteria bacterium]|nr:hypothetical protein [Pseudomonadota bacterium]